MGYYIGSILGSCPKGGGSTPPPALKYVKKIYLFIGFILNLRSQFCVLGCYYRPGLFGGMVYATDLKSVSL